MKQDRTGQEVDRKRRRPSAYRIYWMLYSWSMEYPGMKLVQRLERKESSWLLHQKFSSLLTL